MKKFILVAVNLLLAACSIQKPSLTHSQKPILNITADANSYIEASVSQNSAWVKNKTNQPINVCYSLYWYDQNGVTQVFSPQQDKYRASLLLQPLQKSEINLSRPTPESVNYRLYLHMN
ncbi:DUF1425 domain-containing protein [Pasteurella bettyae]|uniref:PF07233 family protein n=1 Tax=Pasteurella bettyae CCUG 2042 TaxID=1095749 RepID=I3DJ92_9PAST|nr:DUF1425 domain-containing protein [Pasteurella bettyae]EIJ71785.1 PF07233 family protein [Pasteurella bettyae CCUG 2042]SUB22461.1 Predicted periplasmic lipoprotein [Pasteurella bettyae]